MNSLESMSGCLLWRLRVYRMENLLHGPSLLHGRPSDDARANKTKQVSTRTSPWRRRRRLLTDEMRDRRAVLSSASVGIVSPVGGRPATDEVGTGDRNEK